MITVRRATADEVVDVRHRVLREGRPRETAVFAGDTEATTRHWVALDASGVVGVVSVVLAEMPELLTPRPRWQLRGMAVLPDLQGSGVGRALLEAVHTDVDEPLWCNARANVVGFYTSAGWEPVGEVFPIAPIGPHQRMVRQA
ncbi:MAG: GNAT family N-acetyltransferase [Alphaproteobacteria bacterium]|nr:GNAT family N-acetyltransferase [Alphaproteobacteria bacterium]MCB9692217.1 GNAT family N-acetyltransferase [Alphaproteobacteria bacterium]